ncbi:nitrilotriacetate monooxygenase [Comamonas serinivorans]|uniref:Nitrilotriacetate monooxygenase n=1 Tax=Comamonas serinivorans TaxID=1082851 RepID=A0A1Y0EMV7_9BURK|nr:LLM class flavin-dependent oxidoreductase [Comamonas serinivorans]ARU04973.1 nitrilotriacetate monooxygenase [Comamonas serinivorans]
MTRTLKLGAYFTGSAVQGDSWRHPQSHIDADQRFDRYLSYAQRLEAACFDAIFFFDNLFAATDRDTVATTPQAPRWDPLVLLSALATHTRRIGLVASVSTSYSQPYNVARQFAALDQLSQGRAGWNVVTSTGGGENFNLDGHLDHALRYERAHEFVEVVTGLWDSWADDAFLRDKVSGQWADPDKLRVLGHQGKHFQVRGPLNAARSPQGWPLISQAGSSEAGKDLAARFGEMLYTAAQDLGQARAFYDDVKARAARHGRLPEHILILPGVMPVIGRTQAEADAKFQALMAARDQPAVLRALSSYASLGIDLAGLAMSDRVPLPEVIPETNSHKSRQKLLVDWIRSEQPTVQDLYTRWSAGGHRLLVGTPEHIADDFQHWFEAGACDGFNVMFSSTPGGLEDFCSLVVPELQRRHLFRRQYSGRTLRDHLGLPRVPNRHFAPASDPAPAAQADAPPSELTAA